MCDSLSLHFINYEHGCSTLSYLGNTISNPLNRYPFRVTEKDDEDGWILQGVKSTITIPVDGTPHEIRGALRKIQSIHALLIVNANIKGVAQEVHQLQKQPLVSKPSIYSLLNHVWSQIVQRSLPPAQVSARVQKKNQITQLPSHIQVVEDRLGGLAVTTQSGTENIVSPIHQMELSSLTAEFPLGVARLFELATKLDQQPDLKQEIELVQSYLAQNNCLPFEHYLPPQEEELFTGMLTETDEQLLQLFKRLEIPWALHSASPAISSEDPSPGTNFYPVVDGQLIYQIGEAGLSFRRYEKPLQPVVSFDEFFDEISWSHTRYSLKDGCYCVLTVKQPLSEYKQRADPFVRWFRSQTISIEKVAEALKNSGFYREVLVYQKEGAPDRIILLYKYSEVIAFERDPYLFQISKKTQVQQEISIYGEFYLVSNGEILTGPLKFPLRYLVPWPFINWYKGQFIDHKVRSLYRSDDGYCFLFRPKNVEELPAIVTFLLQRALFQTVGIFSDEEVIAVCKYEIDVEIREDVIRKDPLTLEFSHCELVAKEGVTENSIYV